jgi:ribokinase
MDVIVFGSINMDLVVRTPRLPEVGETLTGHDFYSAPGGKGANQAVAAARMGATTGMVGRVGNDIFARELLDSLRKNRVDVNAVELDTEHPSGVAVIAVDDESENSIIVIPGANGMVGSADVRRLEGFLEGASVLLVQLEIPMDAVSAAAQAARRSSIRVVLDPAPAQTLPVDLYQHIDYLTPNEVEAGILAGFKINSVDRAREAGRLLLERGVGNVIVKMGKTGAFWCNRVEEEFFTAYQVESIDTVAAGDAFNGAFAVALAEGIEIRQAIRWGMAAGALSTTVKGAQPSMPDRSAVEKLMGG